MSTSQQLNFKLTLCTAISGFHRAAMEAGWVLEWVWGWAFKEEEEEGQRW